MKVSTASHHQLDDTLPLVIVNPKSASGSTHANWSGIASDLRTHFGAFQVEFTAYGGHASEIAEKAARAGRQFVIACGGDGTINEVANGLIASGTDAELGVLPSGTGGDFRRSIGLKDSSAAVARQLRDGETRSIDVGRVRFTNDAGNTDERFFLNVSSVGLAPSVLKKVKGTKTFDWIPSDVLRGKANYALSALQALFEEQPVILRVSIDGGEPKNLQTIAFCVANSRFFGGGMKIAPDAKLNDGMFDVVNVGDIGMARILLNIHTIYRGTHESLKEVHTLRARTIDVSEAEGSSGVQLETDGEISGRLPASYEIIPNKLRVRVPRDR